MEKSRLAAQISDNVQHQQHWFMKILIAAQLAHWQQILVTTITMVLGVQPRSIKQTHTVEINRLNTRRTWQP